MALIIRDMKTTTTSFISNTEKELFIKLSVLACLTLMFCSSLKHLDRKAEPIKIINVNHDRFSNFDKALVPNRSPVIAKMITTLKPKFDQAVTREIASNIQQVLQKYKIAPQIVVAIIDTESDFNHDLVSSTGDLSLAQVNVEIWNREFLRMNLDPIEPERLKADKTYSLEVMAKILTILKTRYEKQDRRWYARYHSKTKKHKKEYLSKLEKRMKLLEKATIIAAN